MQARSFVSWSIRVLFVVLVMASSTWAQFTGNIQGTVSDPSGAAVAQAKVDLVNVVTKVSATTTTDASGDYRFLSLAPGSYKITVEAAGFAKAETTVTLETNQNLNVPISVKVGTATEAVTVTAEAPLVNTAETRNQQTLETQELSTLPVAGRNMLSLVSRSEEHTSELQSQSNLVCRLLLEKKNTLQPFVPAIWLDFFILQDDAADCSFLSFAHPLPPPVLACPPAQTPRVTPSCALIYAPVA